MTEPRRELDLAHAAAMPAPMGGALPTSLEWQALDNMAQTLAASDVIPYRLKRKPADVAVILLAAREYGIPPLMALSKLPVVNGTPAPMGELMVALVLRAGHSIRAKVYNEDGSERKGEGARQPITPGTYAECVTLRRDEQKGDEDRLTFTVDEALSAGLIDRLEGGRTVALKDGKPTPWQQYPDNMLRWRAVANACRLRFPDVLLGLSYLPEELGATVDAEGAPIVDGEAVTVRTTAAPRQTVEQRTAQETADRAATFTGDPVVLEVNVLQHAEENGYADELVDWDGPEGTRNRSPLRLVLTALATRLRERTVEQPPSASEAPASAPADTAPASQSPQDTDGPSEAILGAIVEEAAETDDVDRVRALFRENGENAGTGLNRADVTDLLEDDDARVLGITTPVTLGAFLMAIGKRLAAGDGPLAPPTDPTNPEPVRDWTDAPDPRDPDTVERPA